MIFIISTIYANQVAILAFERRTEFNEDICNGRTDHILQITYPSINIWYVLRVMKFYLKMYIDDGNYDLAEYPLNSQQ